MGPPLAAACSPAVMGTSEAPKSTCPALNAAMPALLPTAEYPMVTPGCCCWYLAKATVKDGASNVEPAPVRVGAWPPALAAATTDAAVPGPAVLALLAHAA